MKADSFGVTTVLSGTASRARDPFGRRNLDSHSPIFVY